MQEFEPRLEHLFAIWWLRTWRGFLAGTLAVAPFALGLWLLERSGVQSYTLKLAYQALIGVIGAGVAFWISRMSLTKRYNDFRIALLSHDGAVELKPTNSRVLSFWWFLVWRVTSGAAVISLFGELAAELYPHAVATRVTLVVATVMAWEFYVLRQALTRPYRNFRIALITHSLES